MKWLQETTEWIAPYEVPNHVYYMNDGRTHAVGYIPTGTGRYQKFSQPIAIDTRRRKFTVLTKKAEPDSTYFTKKPTEAAVTGSIQVEGSGGKKYTLTPGPNGWICTCPGFQFRRACKHSAAVKKP